MFWCENAKWHWIEQAAGKPPVGASCLRVQRDRQPRGLPQDLPQEHATSPVNTGLRTRYVIRLATIGPVTTRGLTMVRARVRCSVFLRKAQQIQAITNCG